MEDATVKVLSEEVFSTRTIRFEITVGDQLGFGDVIITRRSTDTHEDVDYRIEWEQPIMGITDDLVIDMVLEEVRSY